ncbi:MAG: peptidoglycan bridge formation glycyltransferase FemA/FemB family protein [Spirochaetia bacterium]|nr:peptidoglycan bridge formation glycyltransferase FemA/FemB family protein [Spirochaetia bacterium]
MSIRFQQSDFWCGFKSAHGWKSFKIDGINVLVRAFKKGPVGFSVCYVPMAPEYEQKGIVPGFEMQAVSEVEYVRTLGFLSEKIKAELPQKPLFIRFDVPLDMPSVEVRDDYLFRLGELARSAKVNLKKSRTDIQPPDSTFLDLSLSEEQLLKNMKSKWRYNIRYASKHGVEVRAVDFNSPDFEKDLKSFYSLYRETAERDGIGLHPLSYYRDLLERGEKSSGSEEKTKITLYLAACEGEDLAGIITLFQEDEAVYLYGASSNKKRNLMPNYLVQWTAICDAKKFGSKIYDFYGIPPTGSENHPMHGLYLFKTGFGGREVHRPGSVDLPLSGFYGLYCLAENLRAFYHKKIMKKIRGR